MSDIKSTVPRQRAAAVPQDGPFPDPGVATERADPHLSSLSQRREAEAEADHTGAGTGPAPQVEVDRARRVPEPHDRRVAAGGRTGGGRAAAKAEHGDRQGRCR